MAKKAKRTPHPVVMALREARLDQRISQFKLAAIMDCGRSKIHHIELGHTDATLDFLTEYGKVVGLELTVVTTPAQERAS